MTQSVREEGEREVTDTPLSDISSKKVEEKEASSTTDESEQRPANASDPTLTDMSEPTDRSAAARTSHDPAFTCGVSSAEPRPAPPDAPSVATPSSRTKFEAGDAVVYTSSAGRRLRATVMRSHRDKKNRPYYVVHLEEGEQEGKEKQVYGHRLRLYAREDGNGPSRGRSSRAAQDGAEGDCQGRSAAWRYGGVHDEQSAATPARGRRSRSRCRDKPLAASVREGSAAAPPGARRRRDESLSSSVRECPAPRRHRDESLASTGAHRRPRSPSRGRSVRGRSRSVARLLKRPAVSGAASRRSRSRAPKCEDTALRSSRSQHDPAPSKASGRQNGAAMPGGGGGDYHSLYSGSDDARSKGRSLSKLRSFRKSFAGNNKK